MPCETEGRCGSGPGRPASCNGLGQYPRVYNPHGGTLKTQTVSRETATPATVDSEGHTYDLAGNPITQTSACLGANGPAGNGAEGGHYMPHLAPGAQHSGGTYCAYQCSRFGLSCENFRPHEASIPLTLRK
jgi:hypothetical protein